jgi:hypothetical protein
MLIDGMHNVQLPTGKLHLQSSRALETVSCRREHRHFRHRANSLNMNFTWANHSLAWRKPITLTGQPPLCPVSIGEGTISQCSVRRQKFGTNAYPTARSGPLRSPHITMQPLPQQGLKRPSVAFCSGLNTLANGYGTETGTNKGDIWDAATPAALCIRRQ